jgi:DNA repair protein RadC
MVALVDWHTNHATTLLSRYKLHSKESKSAMLMALNFLWEKDGNMLYPDFSELSTQELLAITLKENPASEVINELSQHFSLKELTEATASELSAIKGMGKRKATALLASIELAKRLSAPASNITTISSPQDVASLLMNEMRYLDRENFRILLLNTKNHVLKDYLVSVGSVNYSLVHAREIFKPAIKNSASSVILCHSHPSGDPTPSSEDIKITAKLHEAGKLLGIAVLDHVILGDGVFVSLKEKGLL